MVVLSLIAVRRVCFRLAWRGDRGRVEPRTNRAQNQRVGTRSFSLGLSQHAHAFISARYTARVSGFWWHPDGGQYFRDHTRAVPANFETNMGGRMSLQPPAPRLMSRGECTVPAVVVYACMHKRSCRPLSFVLDGSSRQVPRSHWFAVRLA